MSDKEFGSPEECRERLAKVGYVASSRIATCVYLASKLDKPILCEGPAGVGKTELAKAVADTLHTELIRLQCYEGLDESRALYEWKYGKQLLYTQMLRAKIDELIAGSESLEEASKRLSDHDDAFFSEQFIEARPLLSAMRQDKRTVLLIDEVDRAEEELEAFFLEVLAEYQVTIPELGTIRAVHKPIVILTSNNTRELSDALRRRCIHLAIDYPSPELEARIIDARLPGIDAALRQHLVELVAKLRQMQLKKSPSVSETLDWARALALLECKELDAEHFEQTVNLLLKYSGDQEQAIAALDQLFPSAP